MRRFVGLAAIVLWGCAEGIPPDQQTGGGPDNGGGSTMPPPSGTAIGTFQLDYYYLPLQSDYGDAPSTPMTDANCSTLATVPATFEIDVVAAGAGMLTDGRVVTSLGPCICAQSPYCFAVAATPWGSGAAGRPLSPFRSIAVQGHTLAVGMKVYAPSLAGVRMPGAPPAGGFVHDGCLVIDDRGADRMRIDLFTGLRSYEQSLSPALGANLQLYPADAGNCL